MEGNDQQQVAVLANRIAKENYDLIGLQEVNQLLASPFSKRRQILSTNERTGSQLIKIIFYYY